MVVTEALADRLCDSVGVAHAVKHALAENDNEGVAEGENVLLVVAERLWLGEGEKVPDAVAQLLCERLGVLKGDTEGVKLAVPLKEAEKQLVAVKVAEGVLLLEMEALPESDTDEDALGYKEPLLSRVGGGGFVIVRLPEPLVEAVLLGLPDAVPQAEGDAVGDRDGEEIPLKDPDPELQELCDALKLPQPDALKLLEGLALTELVVLQLGLGVIVALTEPVALRLCVSDIVAQDVPLVLRLCVTDALEEAEKQLVAVKVAEGVLLLEMEALPESDTDEDALG